MARAEDSTLQEWNIKCNWITKRDTRQSQPIVW